MPQNINKNIIQIIPNMEIGGAEKTVLEIGSFLKNIGLAGGFLFIVVNGPKRFSIDNKK